MALFKNRKPVVSGRFYSNNADELKKNLEKYFNEAEKLNDIQHVNALISPHAGYVYSGNIAASAFKQVNRETHYNNIFILAPSHHISFNGASIYNIGNYETPLGEAEVNKSLANKLIEEHKSFTFYNDAHSHEHSLEVQIPFIQYWIKPGYKIIPIVIGTQDFAQLRKISEALSPYFTNENLFVISSDFSHFPIYNDAIKADNRIAEAILSKKISNVENAIKQNKEDKIDNLATSSCGISAIYCLLYLMQNNTELEIKKIMYANSGDSKYGDHDRVVGYLSFAIYSSSLPDIDVKLSEIEKKELLNIARTAIEKRLNKENFEINPNNFEAPLTDSFGVFVSLHSKGKLRGCIGRFETNEPLYQLVKLMAQSAAFTDSRFSPITIDELYDLEIEISVLSPLHEIKNKDEIILGKHGIYIKDGYNRGTLLPQVATSNNWSVTEFLGYCAKNKAGIGWNGWKTADLFVYSANVFSE